MKTSFIRLYVTLFLLLSFAVAVPHAAFSQTGAAAPATATTTGYASALQSIEDRLETRRKELGIPGVALVIVKDDQVIYSKGLGYKDFEKQVPVTADTQFAIGSATKAFTALTVLMAQDEGKLSLEDSPKKYLPYFRMYDPETDKNITIRDLLSHSSGLNRTDLAMVTGKLDRAELIQVAAQAKPTAKLREKFQYQNIMFVAAGETAAAAEKSAWDKLVSERIFKPLGMTNSTLSIAQLKKVNDRSLGYNYNFDTKETRMLPYREIVQVAPAGSINSSANDMAKWLRFVLDGGVANGKRLLSEKGYEEWTKPQMKITPKMSYGLGWFLQDWNGLKVIQHGGNIDGFNSLVAMVPEKKLGFVLLTNVSASSLGGDMMPVIWSNILGENKPAGAEKPSTAAMEKLVGTYFLEGPKWNIEVKIEGGDLVMIVPGQPPYKLERTGDREYKPAGLPDGFGANFSPKQGNATELELLQPPDRRNIAKRIENGPANAEVKSSDGAKELIGQYSPPAGDGTIEIKESGASVTLSIPGQQPYALIERSKDVYALSPLPEGYSLSPKRGADGKIVSFVVKQPEGEFEFKRKAATEKPSISIDELMKKYVDAIGGETNWRKFTTRVAEYDVDLENQGVKATATSWNKAPNKAATETVIMALNKKIATGWEFFDGNGGEEIYSFAPAEKFAGKRLEDARLGADFYAPLNWKANYKKVEVTGTAKVGGEDAYVVSYESEKGTPFKEYYSTKTFLLLKREGVVPSSTSPQQLPYTVTFADYRDVDGIKLPFKIVNNSISNGNIVQILKSVKNNVPIDDKIFSPKKPQ